MDGWVCMDYWVTGSRNWVGDGRMEEWTEELMDGCVGGFGVGGWIPGVGATPGIGSTFIPFGPCGTGPCPSGPPVKVSYTYPLIFYT